MDSRSFPLSRKSKHEILSSAFNLDPAAVEELAATSQSYFSYYQKCLESCQANNLTNTHQDVVKLLGTLTAVATKADIEDQFRKMLRDDEMDEADEILEEAIDLATRLLLMVPTGGYSAAGRSITLSGGTKFNWKSGTIGQLVGREFIGQNNMKQSVRLERIFNARNLERIGGVEIRWTNNLADHLRMRDDDKAVEIFHHATFLRLHQHGSIFPADFITETLQTLALLLPEHDRDVEQWASEHQTRLQKRRKLPLDPLMQECGQLKVEERQIEQFHYWHDRIVMLKQVFDEAEPRNMKQWWRDRRKRVQWYTFWVAALVLGLTIFFGLVQSVEGALQVWLAMKSSA